MKVKIQMPSRKQKLTRHEPLSSRLPVPPVLSRIRTKQRKR